MFFRYEFARFNDSYIKFVADRLLVTLDIKKYG